MFFQDATPDTSGYMIAGYVIAFLVMALYVASMYMRSRNLKQDMSTLEELDRTAAPVAKAEPKAAPKPVAANASKPVTKTASKK